MVGIATLALAGCASSNKPLYPENFGSANTYSRTYQASDAASCDAARRSLLSQGYTIGKASKDAVEGTKNFQGDDQKHTQISFHVVCAADGNDANKTTVFVNAVQDHYIIKKTSSSAGVGLSVLGSVSMPFGSNDDSLAKVASETISSPQFYDGFFGLMASNLPQASPGGVEKDAPSKDAAKTEAKKADSAKDAAKSQEPKADAAKDAPKPEAPKADTAKPDAPAAPAASPSSATPPSPDTPSGSTAGPPGQ
jgi:hypothetical protein